MCGVSGVAWRTDDAAARRFLGDCLADHARRGPDREATETATVGDWQVAFGHRRLSIIDLSASGDQPMWRRAALITYNGEIYNYLEIRAELVGLGHRFGSQSDTEVVLAAYAAWGEDAFARMNGMFAIALLDVEARRLVLVRDRFGVKPLHYRCEAGRLLFSSTPGPIARVAGARPDLGFVAAGLIGQRFENGSERTQYDGVAAVMPGHVYSVALDTDRLNVERRRYYDLDQAARAKDADGTGATACLERLSGSVALRLRSDVPVGVSLSAGLDSSSIAALMRQSRRVPAFCFGHPDRAETEGPAVERLRHDLDLDVTWVWPTPAEMAATYWDCLEAQDAPFTTGSIVAQFAVYRAARAAGIRVILGGQGGDEVFLGYRKALLWALADAWRAGNAGQALRRLGGLGMALLTELPVLGRYRGAIGPRLGWVPEAKGFPSAPMAAAESGDRTVRGRQIGDIVGGGLPTLLRYEDRNSMANSVESRLPFLDYRLVEWAVSLPTRAKVSPTGGKRVLREALRGLVPAWLIDDRVKRGFDVGTEGWIQAGLGSAIRNELARVQGRLRSDLGWQIDPVGFSDHALATDRGRFLTATTAIWLGRVLQ